MKGVDKEQVGRLYCDVQNVSKDEPKVDPFLPSHLFENSDLWSFDNVEGNDSRLRLQEGCCADPGPSSKLSYVRTLLCQSS